MKELAFLCSILLIHLVRAIYPSLKMITWPFLMRLKSGHLHCFRTEWGTFLQSNQKTWRSPGPQSSWHCAWGASGEARTAWVGWGMLAGVRFPQAHPGPLDPRQRVTHWLSKSFTSLRRRTVLVLPRPKRVTCDSISFKGTEPRQQLLLIFNTKIQGKSEGKDPLLPRIETRDWKNPQLGPVSSPVHCFAFLRELPKRGWQRFFLIGWVVWGGRAAKW